MLSELEDPRIVEPQPTLQVAPAQGVIKRVLVLSHKQSTNPETGYG